MEIIVDECLHNETIELLKNKRFITLEIGTILKWGAIDEDIYDYASEKNIPIITHDRRFGKIYFDSKDNPSMTIVLKVLSPHPKETNLLSEEFLNKVDINSAKFKNKLIVITDNKVRIRSKI